MQAARAQHVPSFADLQAIATSRCAVPAVLSQSQIRIYSRLAACLTCVQGYASELEDTRTRI